MPKTSILTKKKNFLKTDKQITKLLRGKRKSAIELCIILAKDLIAKMGEDKLYEKLTDENVSFETKNFSNQSITGIRKLGVKVEDGYTDKKEVDFKWHELKTETIVNLADALSDIHEEMQKHI